MMIMMVRQKYRERNLLSFGCRNKGRDSHRVAIHKQPFELLMSLCSQLNLPAKSSERSVYSKLS
jgi:hypothetical protein